MRSTSSSGHGVVVTKDRPPSNTNPDGCCLATITLSPHHHTLLRSPSSDAETYGHLILQDRINYIAQVAYLSFNTAIMGVASMVMLVLITILFPPLGVWIVAGCGMDLFINICLTVLGLLPGHLHAFYIIWVYYDRREQAREGRYAARPAPGVYSSHVQTGGGHGYGTVNYPPTH